VKSLSRKETVDRIWRYRREVKEKIVREKNKEILKESLDYNLDNYIAENGLPSGYLTREEVLSDLELTLI
jgi:hypothetical protein